MSIRSLCVALLATGLAYPASAADKQAAPAGKEQIEKFVSQKSDRKPSCCRASTVNFNKELGIPLEYLNTIGTRIATARKAPDPVDLANAAQALAAAEAAAGKKASVTAEEVYAEALALVKLRNVSTELLAFATITPDQATRKELTNAAAKAKKLKAEQNPETTREILGSLTVVNQSSECVKIYVDGRYVGTVHEGEVERFRVHTHSHNTEITAICEEDGEVVGQAYAHGHNHPVSWTVR
ncbi:MAG: hypothetical protein LC104_14730 [Bacteroidales bacterium]|nr:hypothetical protein [Bacteroidales bacterium]